MTSSAGQPMNVGVNSTWTRRRRPDVPDDAEVDDRDHRELGVGDLRERLPDVAPAAGPTESRGTVTSAHPRARCGGRRSSPRAARRAPPRGAARHRLDVRAACEPSFASTRSTSSGRSALVEHAERIRPELVERLLEPRAALGRGEQTVDPHLRVDPVVDLLAVDLRRDPRELGVVRAP